MFEQLSRLVRTAIASSRHIDNALLDHVVAAESDSCACRGRGEWRWCYNSGKVSRYRVAGCVSIPEAVLIAAAVAAADLLPDYCCIFNCRSSGSRRVKG